MENNNNGLGDGEAAAAAAAAIVPRPVVIWPSLGLQAVRPSECWIDERELVARIGRSGKKHPSDAELEEWMMLGDEKGEEGKDPVVVVWKSPEHCCLLVGYEEQQDRVVVVMDPHTGKLDRLDAGLFQERWRELGSMAVSISIKTKMNK